MKDRELLALAAKAAGAKKISFTSGELALYNPFGETGNCFWNPLTDDGDALRLVARLRMEFSIVESTAFACYFDYSTLTSRVLEEPINDAQNDLAATRRVIVRAAASIGEQMREQS